MPMIKQFSGPNTALLWSYWRLGPWWVLLTVPVLCIAGPEIPAGALLYLAWMLLLAATAGWLDISHRAQPLNLWIPIAPLRVVLVESLVAAVWSSIVALGLWAGLTLSTTALAVSPLFLLLNALLAGLMAVSLFRCVDAMGNIFGLVVFLFMALAMFLVVRAQTDYVGWLSVTLWTFCTGAGVLGLHVYLLRLDRSGPAPREWSAPNVSIDHANLSNHATRQSSPAYAEIAESSRVPLSSPPSLSWDGSPVVTEPFTSAITAQAWYDARLLLGSVPQQVMTSVMAFGMLGLYAIIMQDSDPGNPRPLYFASFFGFYLTVQIQAALAQPGLLSNRLPLSVWNQSRSCFLLHGTLLAVVCVLLWGIAVAGITSTGGMVFEPEGGIAAPTSAYWLLAATLWSGWVGLVLGATYYLSAMISDIFFSLREPQTEVSVLLETILLSAFVLAINRTTNRRVGASTLACLAAAALVVAGHAAMARYPLTPQLHWFCREALGTALVLAMLHHYTRAGVLPGKVSRLLTRSLLAGAFSTCIYVFLFGTPLEPVRGILPIYLALGVVPPMFLPLMVIPHLVCWNRNHAAWGARLRRNVPWMR